MAMPRPGTGNAPIQDTCGQAVLELRA